jgi:hypothetical protein
MVRDGDVTVASNYQAVLGVLRAVGRRVQVYVADEDSRLVADEVLSDVVRTFDDAIVPAAARVVGLASDVDGDGRFTVLLSHLLSHFGNGRHAVDGFVRVTDLDSSFSPPFGNRCDMMCLSTRLRPGPHLRTILAHEYMHAVVFSKKTPEDAGARVARVEEEGWLDEGLAHLFEDLLSFSRSNIDYRASAFLAQPERYRLVVDDYYAADLFRSHGNRGSTYLFLRWCVDQYGPDLIPTLVHSRLRGVANLEQATGCSFKELYRRWSISLFTDGQPALPLPAVEGDRGPIAPQASAATGWPLSGPRPRWLHPGGPSDRWEAEGTSSHFVLIPGRAAGAIEITVNGPPEADLQVTAVPLPGDMGRVELTIDQLPARAGDLRVQALVRRSGIRPVALRTLTWEPLVPPPDPHGPGAWRGRLDAPRLGSLVGGAEIPSNSSLRSHPFALPTLGAASGPAVIRLMGTDSSGKRLTAWAVVDAPREPNDDIASARSPARPR